MRRVALGLAVAAAVGAISIGLALNDARTAPAYAAWTAVPATAPGAPLPSAKLEQWASKCSDLGVGGVSVQGVPTRPRAAAARTVLVDRRGSYTYCLDISPGTAVTSDPLIAVSGLRSDSGRDKGLNSMWTTTSDKPYARPAGGDLLVLGGDLKNPPETDRQKGVISVEAYQLYGMVGDEVTGVDILLTNGLRITATVRNGLWGAWWPMDKGDPTGIQLEVHTGTQTRFVDPTTAQLPQP